MAVFARVYALDGCWAVACRLADGSGAVMATGAGSGLVVFERGGDPADEAMAFVALECGLGNRGVGGSQRSRTL